MDDEAEGEFAQIIALSNSSVEKQFDASSDYATSRFSDNECEAS
jgi:hypothetical protein